MRRDMCLAARKGADTVECRLDLLDQIPCADEVQSLLASAPVDTIVTARPERQGGRFGGDESTRLELLRHAARFATFVDIEDDVPVAQWPKGRIIVSRHDFSGNMPQLQQIVRNLEDSSAEVVKVAFTAQGPRDALRALDVLRDARKPTIALAMGEEGVASRIVCAKFGAFGTFASLDSESPTAPGQVTIDQMTGLYRWNDINADTRLFGVIACPVAHSMSPAIHNAAFGATGYNGVYVPLLVKAGAANFTDLMDELLSRPWLDWLGLSVTIPHKENAIAYVGIGNCDELSVKIGAINTVVIQASNALRGMNTDYGAAVDSLCHAMGIERAGLGGMKVSVLGAGGVARAVVAALSYYGAIVTVHNRTHERARALADEFGCDWKPLDQAHATAAEVIINCTSTGMHPNVDSSPIASLPGGVRVVFDTIYNPLKTRLLVQSSHQGARTVSGLEMFVNQAAEQFEAWTQIPAPRSVMRDVIVERLSRDQ